MSAQKDEKKLWAMLDRFFLRVLGEKQGKEVMAESREQAAAFLAATQEASPSRRETMQSTILPRTAAYTVLKRRGLEMKNVAYLVTRSTSQRSEEVYDQMDMYVKDAHRMAVSLRPGSEGYEFWRNDFVQNVRRWLDN